MHFIFYLYILYLDLLILKLKNITGTLNDFLSYLLLAYQHTVYFLLIKERQKKTQALNPKDQEFNVALLYFKFLAHPSVSCSDYESQRLPHIIIIIIPEGGESGLGEKRKMAGS